MSSSVKRPLPVVRLSQHEHRGWSDADALLLRLARVAMALRTSRKNDVLRWVGRRFGGNGRNVVWTFDGQRLAVDARCLDVFGWIQVAGTWEPWVVAACRGLARPGDVLYDVGAHVGCVTMSAAARVGPAGRVFAFEPQPDLARTLAVSARLNRHENVVVVPVMLGDHAGDAHLAVPDDSLLASRIPRGRRFTSIPRELWTVDDVVAAGGLPPPDVVKLDAEGAELEILRGATGTLRRVQPAVVFECDENAARFGYTLGDVLEVLADIGDYDFHAVTASGFTPLAGRAPRSSAQTFAAVPRGRRFARDGFDRTVLDAGARFQSLGLRARAA